MALLDRDELEKFEQLADRWWDPEGEFKPLHQIQPLRLDYIQGIVRLEGCRVLDVGCGGGILAEGLAEAGSQVVGLDPGEQAIQAARVHLQVSQLPIEYRQGTVADLLGTEDATFDVITCLEVLEHVPEPGKLLKECTRLLKPGGVLFVATLNRTVRSYLFAIIGAEYILGMLPRGTHQWSRFIRPGEMETYMRQACLIPEGLCGITYNPLNDSFHLSRDLAVNYLGYARRPKDIS